MSMFPELEEQVRSLQEFLRLNVIDQAAFEQAIQRLQEQHGSQRVMSLINLSQSQVGDVSFGDVVGGHAIKSKVAIAL